MIHPVAYQLKDEVSVFDDNGTFKYRGKIGGIIHTEPPMYEVQRAGTLCLSEINTRIPQECLKPAVKSCVGC